MKSKTLRIRNIPMEPPVIESICVKPTIFLMGMVVFGAMLAMLHIEWMYLGVLIIGIAIFSLVVLPDRKLLEFTYDFMILYNCKDRELCKIVYWDEILSWQVLWRAKRDILEIELVDNSVELLDIVAKGRVITFLRTYVKDKERGRKK